MGETLLLIVLFVGILLLVFRYLIAREFYNAAVMKGHEETKYLWLTFFFGIVGVLLVIALPDSSKSVPPQSYKLVSRPTPRSEPESDRLPKL